MRDIEMQRKRNERYSNAEKESSVGEIAPATTELQY